MKVRDALLLIEADSWHLARTRGSHRQYKHSAQSGSIAISRKPSDDLAPGTISSIRPQAQL